MIVVQLLQLFVAFLALAAIGCAFEVAATWWTARNQYRNLPRPPLTNDQRVRAYLENERAYRGLR